MDNQASQLEPRCPRCGYELRGIMASWEKVCDLNDTCSECGLEYEWGELLNPRRNVPKWCVEYAEGWRFGFLFRMIRTLLKMLRPWRFWRELRMYHTPHWRGLALLHLYLLAGVYLVFVISLGIYVADDWIWEPGPYVTNLTATRLEVVCTTILLPISQRSPGTYQESRLAYDSTNQPTGIIVKDNHIPAPSIYAKKYLDDWLKDNGVGVLMLAMYFLASPMCFFALPQSRKQAKVNWNHIVRISAYATLLVWPFLCLSLFATSVRNQVHLWRYDFEFLMAFSFLGLIVYGFVWWSLAASRYLKMPQPWAVGLAISVMTLLGMMLIGTCIGLYI